MQVKSSQNLTERLERLKFANGWTDEELATNIDVSRRLLWLLRSEKRDISSKTWWKLEEAEHRFGCHPRQESQRQVQHDAPDNQVHSDSKAPLEEVKAIASALRELCIRIDRLEKMLNK